MREITFRARHMETGEWFYGNSNTTREVCLSTQHLVPITIFWQWVQLGVLDPETIGEYTGRHDTNGVAIYNGDKLQWRWYGTDKVNGELRKTEVTWDAYLLQWYAQPNPLYRLAGRDELEVIGNIWENPE